MTIRIPRWLLWCVGLIGVFWLITLGTPSRARQSSRRNECHGNLKQIALACLQYRQDADGYLPPVRSDDFRGWADILHPYYGSRSIFQCPEGTATAWERTSDYFYNANVATKATVKDPELTVLFGDGPDNGGTDSNYSALPTGWDDPEPTNYTNTDTTLPSRRHLYNANYVFVDGHVQSLRPSRVHTLKIDGLG